MRCKWIDSAQLKSQTIFFSRYRDESFAPVIIVERVAIRHEAVRFIAEARQRPRASDAVPSVLLGGVHAEDLQVVAVLFVPDQRSVLVAVLGRCAVEKSGMTHVPEQK